MELAQLGPDYSNDIIVPMNIVLNRLIEVAYQMGRSARHARLVLVTMTNTARQPEPEIDPLDVVKTHVSKGEETALTFKITYTDRQIMTWVRWLLENYGNKVGW